jgi:hypothetical protein
MLKELHFFLKGVSQNNCIILISLLLVLSCCFIAYKNIKFLIKSPIELRFYLKFIFSKANLNRWFFSFYGCLFLADFIFLLALTLLIYRIAI